MAIITPRCTDFAWGCAPRPRLDSVLITTRQDPASREVHPGCVTGCVGPQLMLIFSTVADGAIIIHTAPARASGGPERRLKPHFA